MYDPAMVQPMRDELTQAGVKELLTPDQVDEAIAAPDGTCAVLVNSVCGCAAGSARPGYIQALSNEVLPDTVATVFAGVDREAVEAARSHIHGYAPSSPSIALFREGQVVHVIERHQIEGTDAGTIGKMLKAAFDRYCGESVDESIPLYDPEAEMEIEVEAVKAGLDSGDALVFDIRGEEEATMARIAGVPVLDQERANQLVEKEDRDRLIVFHCHHGMRSRQAVKYFAQFGFTNCKSMRGGIQAWSERIDPAVPTY